MSYPTIREGYTGSVVQTLRAALAANNLRPAYTVLNPNLFDAWVTAAVRTYQQLNGLVVDGVVGPNTWAKLLNRPDLATKTGPSATAADPSTSSIAPTGSAASAGASGGSNMLPLLLGAGGLAALWLWWRSRAGRSLRRSS